MNTLTAYLHRLWILILTGLCSLFGTVNWQPPRWLHALKGGCCALLLSIKKKPLPSALLLLALILLGGAGGYAYQWWQTRPKPVTVDFTLSAPARTELENNLPPNPLVLNFASSVAPLALVDKAVTQGISLSPALSGTWKWLDDKQLQFQPAQNWPIGTRYTVKLEKNVVAEAIQLQQWSTEFDTPPFTVALEKSEFYQDPLDPALKKAIFQLRFSHPVDTQSLDKHLQLALNYPSDSKQAAKPLNFTATTDKLKLNAFVHSQTLTVPRDDQVVTLTLEEDVQAEGSKATYPQTLTANVTVPGVFNGLNINDVQITSAPNAQTQQLDQLLVINTSLPVQEQEMAKALHIWLLPEDNPKAATRYTPPYNWAKDEVTADVLKRSTRLPAQAVPAEQEFTPIHSLQIQADAKRVLYVKIDKPLQSFGGYQLPATYTSTLVVPELTKELHIMGEGSLLTLSGDKKIAVMTRDVAGVKVELGRVLPNQLQHFVSQAGGDFSHPEFTSDFGQDNLSERFTLDIPLPSLAHGKVHYQPVDLSQYMVDAQGQDKRGIFLMTTRNYDPKQKTDESPDSETDVDANSEAEPDADAETNADNSEPSDADVEDKRLILVTDLGIIAKAELDGAQAVFVQSIQSGQPQVDADVQLMAKNGLILFQGKTDATGKVRFPKLSGLEREREPMLYLVKYQGDMSFLPLKREDRKLDFSRFDVGGVANALDPGQLNAYLFSDRGIYRPGDSFNIGLIVKTEGWRMPLLGLPLEAEILDPRGLVVKRIKLQLAAGGFNELSYQTLDTAPTGNYTINLYTVKDNKTDQQLGSTQVKVEEFQPDRMKATATFSKPVTGRIGSLPITTLPPSLGGDGWIHPDDLQLNVDVQNLYGAPAEARQVEASLTLKPVLPAFKRFQDYHFHDPHYAKEGFNETLSPQQTDAKGHVAFNLDLQKYTRASYQLHVLARAFEAQGGRSVAAEADTLVSDMPFLLGYKADGALDFVAKDAQRTVHVLAIDPRLQPIQAEHLTLELVERKVLSVLIRQEDNTYRYESRPKETSVRQEPFTLPKDGYNLNLDSRTPGNYAYILRNADGLILTRIDYSVAGVGNVSRSLDRNAELQLTLDKSEYAPGDKITLNIRAPYTGAGLITIERDKVYASTWFKADTQATVQSIDIPKELTGNAYVTVQYSRAPGSDEIFMSPLSYGVAPFKISLTDQTQALTLNVPTLIKPGQWLKMQLKSAEPTRAVVFAVDEGILQVARYQNPNPLAYFFKKRQLAVDTTQILDLILPEFKKLMQAAAPGGDGEDDAGASFLNPFKRRHDQPAVYWSGIIDLAGEKTVSYQVPETFNGSLRVMAVAVNDTRIGSVNQKTQVRGDLILSPNAPFMVAPGDEFTLSVSVANNVKGSGAAAPVNIKLSVPPHLSVLGEAEKTLTIAENHEGVATFRVKAASGKQAILGNARLTFAASVAGQSTQMHSDLSLRPATPKIATLRFGSFRSSQDVAIERLLYPERRNVSAGLSPLPLVALPGLTAYLENYEHSCTEQLISKAMPLLVLDKHPEFAAETTTKITEADLLKLLSVLRTRQNAEGGFGLWAASAEAHEFASVYATHFLIEALSMGLSVPDDMLQKSQDYLQTLAASPATDLSRIGSLPITTLPPSLGIAGIRVRAYAAYLLTRQGTVTTTMLASLRESLRNRYKETEWRNDLSAVYLAASYQLLKQTALAEELIKAPVKQLGQDKAAYQFQDYYDPLIHDGQLVYILAKHFPKHLQALSPTAFQSIAQGLQDNRYNTLSSAYLLLAYHAYLAVITPETAAQLSITATDAAGHQQALALPANLAPRVSFPETTRSLHFEGPSAIPLYYAVSESGYDQRVPERPVSHGLEILRAYLNAQGKAVDHAGLGEELTVQIRLRATGQTDMSNIAVQDLLPAGFEPVIQTPIPPEATDDATAEEEAVPAWQDRLRTGGKWQTDYADIREDRVVLYGTAFQELAEYQYKIKATSAGVFNTPPIYAESLYEKTVQAHSSAGVMRVDEREAPPSVAP